MGCLWCWHVHGWVEDEGEVEGHPH
jgi:hypothetical protein